MKFDSLIIGEEKIVNENCEEKFKNEKLFKSLECLNICHMI